MDVTLDYPSIAAADTIGLFRGYDEQFGHPSEGDSWARKIVSDIDRNGGVTVGYSAEERAVWGWYKDQTEPDAWNKWVSQHKETGSVEVIALPDEFGVAKVAVTKSDIDVDEPNVKPFAGNNGGSGSVAVSTVAINHFANALSVVAPLDGGSGMLSHVIESLDNIDPRPGAFAKAEVLRREIMGTSSGTGLRGETVKVLGSIQAVLAAVQTDVRALAKEYDSAEELNSLTVDQFGDVMRGSDTRITGLGSQSTKDKDLTDG